MSNYPPPLFCPDCGKPNQLDARFCNNCAKPLYDARRLTTNPLNYPQSPNTNLIVPKAPEVVYEEPLTQLDNRKFWEKLNQRERGFIIAISFICIMFFSFIIVRGAFKSGQQKTKTTQITEPTAPSTPAIPATPSAPSAPPEPVKPAIARNPAEILKNAKAALAKGYISAGKNRNWGRINEAKDYLNQLNENDKEYSEGQKLWKEIARREAEIDVWSKAAARELFAKDTEVRYLKDGMDITVSVSGEANTIIKIKYVLISRVWAFQWFTNQELMNKFKSAGFKKIILTDGYRQSYSNDL